MINEIVSGISFALYNEFGKEYKIYKEQIRQGFQTPCFSINCIAPSIQKGLGNRSIKKNTFCIHYFSDSNNARCDCFDVFERMSDCLEYIIVDGDLVQGTDLRAEKISEDGVMHVFVNYDIPVRILEEKERMGTMKSEVKSYGH